MSSNVTQNRILGKVDTDTAIDEGVPVFSTPLNLNLQVGTVAKIWCSYIVDEKTELEMTFNNQDYSLLVKKVEKETIVETSLMCAHGDSMNWRWDDDLIMHRFIVGSSLYIL